MKYKVTYTLQKEVSVIVDIKDKELNEEFNRLGDVKTSSDLTSHDSRWEIEKAAYDEFLSGEHYEDGDENIIDRSIVWFKEII